jgi:hypothetical protein
MPTIHFLGKIVPFTGYSTTMWDLPTINYKSPDTGIETTITIQVKGSMIDVECAMPRFDQRDLSAIHKIAYDSARAAINVVSFATGITLAVVFDQLVNENGTTTAFVIHHPDLGKLCTAYTMEVNKEFAGVGDVLGIILREPGLFLALDDLITSTSLHHLITVNSARSIEGLRHAMTPVAMSRDQEWEVFRTNLNLDKNYIRLITDHSIASRHGEGTFVPGTITAEIARRSWTIMNRFIEFRKRGNLALPIAEFPLLTG